MITRACRTCGASFPALGKTRYCSDGCRCGTDDGYWAGCRCEGCTRAHTRERKVARLRPRPLVSSLGTRRRVEALMCLGWSRAELCRRLDRHRDYLGKAIERSQLEVGTAVLVAQLYAELSMTHSIGPTAGRTAAEARARGYAPPLAWDDHQIDDPNAQPSCDSVFDADVDVDPVVVERVLAGDWSLPSTHAERVEVVARWRAQGRPLRALQQLTGWKVERYYDPTEAVA